MIPVRPGLPFDPMRTTVYSAEELLSGYSAAIPESYRATVDWKCYLEAMDEKTKRRRADLPALDEVYFRLHDLAVEAALAKYLQPKPDEVSSSKRVVGIMGGHDLERREKMEDHSDAAYMKVALLSWQLSKRGFTIATGGGPGAMEAGNLGAYFCNRPIDDLRSAVRMLEVVPKVKPSTPDSIRWNSGEWLAPALGVVSKHPRDSSLQTQSVSVPTWFYGHEPPNVFATHIAKYFENSLREEGLLAICSGGVVYAEGNAGTVQEIFQDACQNYYSTYRPPAPMVLLGTRYWNRSSFGLVDTKSKPAWPLLQQLGSEKAFIDQLLLSDDIDQIIEFLSKNKHN